MDRRGANLVFRCTMIHVDNKILVDFRLSRGCGLEFKKHFAKIKANCAGIIEAGPILWPTLIASNAIPI
jgi:serine/threonine-protein kinase Chk1